MTEQVLPGLPVVAVEMPIRFSTPMASLKRLAVLLLLALTTLPVDAYQLEVSHTLLTQDKASIDVSYTFEWEIVDAAKFNNTGADKAQIQERIEIALKSVLREYAAQSSESDLASLSEGNDAQVRSIAIETNTMIVDWGVQLIDLEF